MRKIILATMLMFLATSYSFAQKKDDDSKHITRGEFAQLIVDTFPWLTEVSNSEYWTNHGYGMCRTDEEHPNHDAIRVTLRLRILDWLGVDCFWPKRSETRYGLIVNLLGLIHFLEEHYEMKFPIVISSIVVPKPFSDIANSKPFHDEIMELFEKGFIDGYPDGTFKGRDIVMIKEVKLALKRIKEKTEALLKEKKAMQK